MLLAVPLSYHAGRAIGQEKAWQGSSSSNRAGADSSYGGAPAGVAVLLLLVAPVSMLLVLVGKMAARLEQPKLAEVSCAAVSAADLLGAAGTALGWLLHSAAAP